MEIHINIARLLGCLAMICGGALAEELEPEIYNQEWQAARATWYGEAEGDGSDGGACGYGDLAVSPYGTRIAAGSAPLFRRGQGCGACYDVKCTLPLCKQEPVHVVITDECPGGDFCGFNRTHFDLSGSAFGDLAIPGRASDLRTIALIPLLFKKIDLGSTAHWLSFVIRYLSGAGDLKSVEIQEANSSLWLPMTHNWGASYDFDGPVIPPVSVRITSGIGNRSVVAINAIPKNWRPGHSYDTGVQFIT